MHRGTKEMDLLLGNFVKKYINKFDDNELMNLKSLLSFPDEILFKWYADNAYKDSVPNNKVSQKLKTFKL